MNRVLENLRYYVVGFLACSLRLLCFTSPVWADGSKDLYPNNTGGRAYLVSSTGRNETTMRSWPFPMLGEHFVYAKVGEYIAVGSSAMGYGNGGIRLTAPNGAVTTNNTTMGRIVARTNELAGPRLPGGGGNTYIPYEILVQPGQEGVWKVEFLPSGPSNSTTQTELPTLSNAGSWTQATDNGTDNLNIAAWDVSVRSNAGGSWQWVPGRVYVNLLHLYLPQQNNDTFLETYGFSATMYTLTKDGYVYRVNNNGNYGVGFVYFSNNNGFINKEANEPLYSSVNSSGNISEFVHDPTSADANGQITNKMFYQLPALDLPASTVSQAVPGGQTWLRIPRIPPEVFEVKIIGYDGTVGQVSNKGGHFYFETDNLASRYTIQILPPLDQPNLFAPRVLTGPAQEGENWIPWDGKDGAGNDLPPGLYEPRVGVGLQTAEVHFPYIDMELNPKGIIIELMKDDYSGVDPGFDLVYWNDQTISNNSTGPNRPNPVNASHTVLPEGTSSLSNGHKWGAYGGTSGATNEGTGNYAFGNEKSIDTWTFVEGEMQSFTPELFVTRADVETVSITSSQTGLVNVGDAWNYTVEVRNNGNMDIVTNTDPDAGRLTGPATFMFYVPSGIEIDPLQVVFNSECGVSIVGTPTFVDGVYAAQLDMPMGCIATFTIPVTAISGIMTGNGNINVWATMLRPDDFTDPDATNPYPDVQPQDPFFEADGIRQAVTGEDGLGNALFLNPGSINLAQTNNIKTNFQPYMLADLMVQKSVNPPSGHSRLEPVDFVIHVTNEGPSDATEVVVTELLNNRYLFVSYVASQGAYDPVTGKWEVGNLINQASATLTITANLTFVEAAQINEASVVAAEYDPDLDNNHDEAETDAIFEADVRVVKSGIRTGLVDGQTLFTLTVQNLGPTLAENVEVLDALSTRYNFVNPGSNHVASQGSLAWAGTSNRNLAWSVGSLEPGSSATLQFTVSNNNDGNWANTATVSADNPDPDENNNSSTLDLPVYTGSPVDLGITKSVDKPSAEPGEIVVFTITLQRVSGTDPVYDVVVTDALPVGFVYFSHTAGEGKYNPQSGMWSIGEIDNDNVRTLVLQAYVGPSSGGANDYLNKAMITSASRADNNIENNLAQASVSLNVLDLALEKTVDDNTPDAEQTVTFTLFVENLGSITANSTQVYDKLPDGYTYTAHSASVGSYNPINGVWTIGNLVSSGTATLEIKAVVNPVGQYTNLSEVYCSNPEISYSNNAVRLDVTPTCLFRNAQPKIKAKTP